MDRSKFIKQGLVLNFSFLICLSVAMLIVSVSTIQIAPILICVLGVLALSAVHYTRWFKSRKFGNLSIALILLCLAGSYYASLFPGINLYIATIPTVVSTGWIEATVSSNKIANNAKMAALFFPGLIAANWGLFALLFLASSMPENGSLGWRGRSKVAI